MVCPAKGINAFGCVYVCGRNLVPAPATGIMAFMECLFISNPLKKGSEYSECFSFFCKGMGGKGSLNYKWKIVRINYRMIAIGFNGP